MRNIRRSATRQIATLKASHTVAVVKARTNDYEAMPVDAAAAWAHYEDYPRARASQKADGTVVLAITGWRWYELSEPTTA